MTRNCEGTNKLPNAKNCNVLLSKLRPVKIFKNYLNFEFLLKNSKTMHRTKKIHE